MKAFAALPFREKLERIEQMNEVARWFAAARRARQERGDEGGRTDSATDVTDQRR